MKLKLFLFFFFLFFSKELIIQEAVYYIIYRNLYFNYKNQKLIISKEKINSSFRIIKKEDNSFILNFSSYYNIEHINTNLNVIYERNITQNVILDLIREKKDESLWTFIKAENNNYRIQNKKKCFIIIRELKIFCENIPENEASLFSLTKIYEEVNKWELDNELIEKEPIDLLIKYIDLRDINLNRTGIHQIQKDFDNEEIRYSIRSVLKNIPWVRKIFILMPNEKIRYFKDYDLIKDKIVYVKDKDILGYDSSNSLAFQFRYWKMKKFGISDNFIVMDDDCFIGNPLKKSDFFYIDNKKIVPAIITSNFFELNITLAKEKINIYRKMINQSKEEQTSAIFRYSLYSTYLFVVNYFNTTLNIPIHTHNAIPVNINDLKEIYDIIDRSKYKYYTLDSLYRHIESLQFQAFILCYTFIKYKRKVKNIKNILIQSKNSIEGNYNFSLFCLNTGPYNYTDLERMKSKLVMEYLFPEPSPFENINNFLPNLAFNIVYTMEKKLKSCIKNCDNNAKSNGDKTKDELFLTKKKKIMKNVFFIVLIIFFYLIYLKMFRLIFKKYNNYNVYSITY